MHFASDTRPIFETAERIELPQGLGSAQEIDAYVGRRLRARRMQVGLSQSMLGRHLGLTFSQVQKYEKGSNRIGAGRLYLMAALLGVPVQYFYEGLNEPPPEPANKATVEAERLRETFLRISDPHARQALLSLAATMVEEG
jgi:transcriptional regulator with XRE-family HTH domain